MTWTTLVIIAVGLSADAFAVSVSSGITIKNVDWMNSLKIALFFGAFQAAMPLLGWAAGQQFSRYIIQYDHWIAFALLTFIGGKMIYETWKDGKGEGEQSNPLDNKVLFLLAVATSIDALAVGISFAFLKVAIVKSVLIIGLITFGLSFIGVHLGDKSGHYLKEYAGYVGGVVLIGIGVKILLEHLSIL